MKEYVWSADFKIYHHPSGLLFSRPNMFPWNLKIVSPIKLIPHILTFQIVSVASYISYWFLKTSSCASLNWVTIYHQNLNNREHRDLYVLYGRGEGGVEI